MADPPPPLLVHVVVECPLMDFSQLNSHSPEIRSHLSKAPHVGDPKQENSIPLIGTTRTTNFVENNVTVGKSFQVSYVFI